MEQTSHLWVFFVMVFGIVLLPGLDMAFILASSLVGGRAAGLSAVAGIIAGGLCHVAMGAIGIMTILQLVPAAFNFVLFAGALYIAWIGVSLLKSDRAFADVKQHEARPHLTTFKQGILTNLLNPKAYLFMLAVFPQFLKPQYGVLWIQALVLWLIIALTQAVVYGKVVIASDRVRLWLRLRPSANIALARVVGGLLIVTAVVTGLQGWRGV